MDKVAHLVEDAKRMCSRSTEIQPPLARRVVSSDRIHKLKDQWIRVSGVADETREAIRSWH